MSQTKAQLIDNLVQALSFTATSSAPANGIYLSATNQLSFATNTTERLRLDSAGQLEAVSLGSAAAPTYSWTTDPDTGVYSPGANQVAISTNGTGRLFVDASGSIGVGVASPVTTLHLQKATGGLAGVQISTSTHGSTLTDGLFVGIDNSIGYLYNYENLPLVFGTNATERMRLDSSGRLGLGTSSPESQLTIQSSTAATFALKTTNNQLAGAPEYSFGEFDFTTTDILAGLTSPVPVARIAARAATASTVPGGELAFYTNAVGSGQTQQPVERLRITEAGRVGIGTTAPDSLLHCGTTSAADNVAIKVQNASATDSAASASIVFTQGANYAAGEIRSVRLGNYSSTAANQDSALAFYTANDGANAERLRIDSSGRLLVGTSSNRGSRIYYPGGDGASNPGLQLEAASTTSTFQVVTNTATVLGAAIVLGKSRGTSSGSIVAVQSGDQLGTIQFNGIDVTTTGDLESCAASIQAQVDGTPGANDMPGRLVFSTTADGASSPTERLRIDSSGRLLVATATTPTNATAVIRGGPGGTNGAHLQLTTATSPYGGGRISVTSTGGSLEFFTHTGDVGSETYTERARIDSSGRLLVGTSSADTSGNALLQVNGSIKGAITSGTAVASTSGTSIDFTGIPSWVKKITVMFNGVSTNGTSITQIQLGTSSGITSSGYSGNGSSCGNAGTWTLAIATTGFYTDGAGSASYTRNGHATITNVSGNIWVYSGTFGVSTIHIASVAGGTVTLASTLDRVRITTVNGTDTFDAGSINILYEG